MPQGAAPRRYAEAAFSLAQGQGALDRWRHDMLLAAGVLNHPRMLALLDDPNRPWAEKRKLIDTALTVKIEPGVQHLVYLLTQRGRVASLQRVVDEFITVANKAQGVVVANVTTAVPLDDARRDEVAERIKRLAGAQQVELHPHVDPRILGGIIAQIGDEMYDGSIRTRLAQLAERIS